MKIVDCWYSAGGRDPWKIRNACIWYQDCDDQHREFHPKQLGIKKKNYSMFALLLPFLIRDLEQVGFRDIEYEAYLKKGYLHE